MTVFNSVKEFREYRYTHFQKSFGFVPTMGALHQGHLSLIEQSKSQNALCVASIFLNPTQFDNAKDLEKYPSSLERDLEQLKTAGCDAVFVPDTKEIYKDDFRYRLSENASSRILCGAHREGHFEGVLTVVLKLFNIIQPTKAYFGEKDFQQLRLIQGMAEALFLPIEVIGCPIVREADGLAMSSRNVRLTPEDRKIAPLFYKTLNRHLPLHEIRSSLKTMGFDVDYVEEHWGRRLAAVKLGEIRLIDNVGVP